MLRKEPSRINPDYPEDEQHEQLPADGVSYPESTGTGGLNIQEELNDLEDLILDSPNIPFTQRRLVDEEEVFDRLDRIRLSLPDALQEALTIIEGRDDLLQQAEEYAQEIIQQAQHQADEILDEMGIVRQAELEAKQIRERVQQECQELQAQTLSDIEQMRLKAQQEVEQMRELAIAECEDIQNGADDYADRVLKNIEQQLNDMLRVIRNGRQQLQADSPSPSTSNKDTTPPTSRSSGNISKK